MSQSQRSSNLGGSSTDIEQAMDVSSYRYLGCRCVVRVLIPHIYMIFTDAACPPPAYGR